MGKCEINLVNTVDLSPEDLTPAMAKFLETKRENPDCLLLYRMGDFYETFFEDAVTMSRELEITLTGRECGKLGRIPLAGIPVKALDGYLEKLVNKERDGDDKHYDDKGRHNLAAVQTPHSTALIFLDLNCISVLSFRHQYFLRRKYVKCFLSNTRLF